MSRERVEKPQLWTIWNEVSPADNLAIPVVAMSNRASADSKTLSTRAIPPSIVTVATPARRYKIVAAACLIASVLAAYSNSLTGQFVFDDQFDIVENFNKRPPLPLWRVLTVSDGQGTHLHSRPVVALTFAVNYCLAGFQTWSYHSTNLAIHLLAALTLFSIVRRTLLLPTALEATNSTNGNRGEDQNPASAAAVSSAENTRAIGLALAIALVWSLHPLNTQAVTYIVQRYESLMGLFFLLTLYCSLRAATSKNCWWQAAGIAACLLAMGCKEVAVSAPLLVLLFDRTFLSGSFRQALRQRPVLYAGLAATWLVFLPLYWFHSGGGGRWAGSGVPVRWYEYAMSELGVVLRYLRLCFWPVGQCAVYDLQLARLPMEIVPPGIAIAALLALTLYAMVRRPAWGFLGAWCFLILAPTSSVLPINDLAFEHRMYLPLAAVAAATVMAVDAACKRTWSPTFARRLCLSLAVCAAATLALATFQRNNVYAGPGAFWLDVLATRPHSLRAHLSLGAALSFANHPEAAIEQLETALAEAPNFPEAYVAHCDLGGCLRRLGRDEEAFQHFAESVRLNNEYARGQLNLGMCLAQRGRYSEACEHLETALKLDPDLPWVRGWLGTVELRLGQVNAAEKHLYEALLTNPDEAVVHLSLGDLMLRQGKKNAAAEHYRKVLQLRPNHQRAQQEVSALEAADDDAHSYPSDSPL